MRCYDLAIEGGRRIRAMIKTDLLVCGRWQAVRGFRRPVGRRVEPWLELRVFPLDGTLLCSDNSFIAVQHMYLKKNM